MSGELNALILMVLENVFVPRSLTNSASAFSGADGMTKVTLTPFWARPLVRS